MKQGIKIVGIYKITNVITQGIYIGSSKDIRRRFSTHKWQLNKRTHKNVHLQRSYNKYGVFGFKFEMIEECSLSVIIEREQHYIDTLKPQYNICTVAYTTLGTKQSKEVVAKRADKLRGRKFPPSFGLAISERMKGRKFTAEHIRNMSLSRKGKGTGNPRKVVQIDRITNDPIQVWTNIRLAARTLNITETNISNSLNGRSGHAGGFKWKYHD